MRMVLLGPPGCGKGTQAELIVKHYDIVHISTGELLRTEVAAGSALGREAETIMAVGGLVSDDLMLNLIEQRLSQADTKHGFLLDGFPRTLAQAESLDQLLDKLQQALDVVVKLDVDASEVMQRLLARGRSDDNETTIRQRLDIYTLQTKPLIDFYQDQGKLQSVSGVGAVDAIWGQIFVALSKLKQPQQSFPGNQSK